MYAYVPNATATSTMANNATMAAENSGVLTGVGEGEEEADGNVIALLDGIQIGSMAAAVVVGVYESVVVS